MLITLPRRSTVRKASPNLQNSVNHDYSMRADKGYGIIESHLQTEDVDEEEKHKRKERTRRD